MRVSEINLRFINVYFLLDKEKKGVSERVSERTRESE